MFLVRTGTPISEIDPNDLPSPRADAKKKKIKVLPHYSEKYDENIKKVNRLLPRKPYEDKNLREILDLLYRNRKNVNATSLYQYMYRKLQLFM